MMTNKYKYELSKIIVHIMQLNIFYETTTYFLEEKKNDITLNNMCII